jgi:hypothetical protein
MQGASHDIWNLNTDLDYHEEQRVEGAATSKSEGE